MCVVGCGQPSATEVDVLVQESAGPANIVWIVVDQLADSEDVDYETVLREGVRVPTEPAQGTSASVHSALLTGLFFYYFAGIYFLAQKMCSNTCNFISVKNCMNSRISSSVFR